MPAQITRRIHKTELLKIKLEVDIDPLNFKTHSELLIKPISFSVRAYQKQDLFVSKLHTLLSSSWTTGRDWFDLVWYVREEIPLNLNHLKTRMIHSGHWKAEQELNKQDLLLLLQDKIDRLDIEQAKEDVIPFIYRDQDQLDAWSQEFFKKIAQLILFLPQAPAG